MADRYKEMERFLKGVKGEHGFTLIETVLALSITVIILGLILSSLRLSYLSWEKGTDVMEEALTRRFIAESFSADAASAYLYTQIEDGRKVYLFNGSESEFAFVTANHSAAPGTPWGGYLFVNYSSGADGLTVSKKTVPVLSLAARGENTPIEIETAVKRVSFEYMGKDGWRESWEMEALKELPRAVRASFFFVEDKTPLKVTVMLGAANSAVAKGTEQREGA
jgi:hypothetical protein